MPSAFGTAVGCPLMPSPEPRLADWQPTRSRGTIVHTHRPLGELNAYTALPFGRAT